MGSREYVGCMASRGYKYVGWRGVIGLGAVGVCRDQGCWGKWGLWVSGVGESSGYVDST